MRRANNFDGLRVIGALLVLVGHGYELTGRHAEVPRLLGFQVHTLGVYVFFSISGYLIAASWLRSRDLWTYATARVLRIFPALLLVVLVTILVIGPLATTLSLRDYLHNSFTWSYVHAAGLWVTQYGLPGVFDANTYPSAINGSLWSLPLEFTCYLVVPVALCVRNRWVSTAAVVAILAVMVTFTVHPVDGPSIFGQPFVFGPSLWACFAAGSLLCLFGGRRILRLDVASVVLVGYVVALIAVPGHVASYAWVALPYVVLAIGEASWPILRSAARFGDLSYGLYLWAFPIQQIVVWRFGILPMPINLLAVTVTTVGVAYLSWHLLETHALRLAKRMQRVHPAA